MAYTNGANLTWIGLKQATYPTSKDWSWTDGSPVYFMFWAPSQPDNAAGSEHCVEIFSDHIGKDPAEDGNYQRWNDISCATNMRSYVCKKPSICYKFSADALPFYMAEEACQSLGGHLVSFQEGLENAMVAETAQQQRTGSPFWIGLNKLNGNAWSYTDDSQVSFTNWKDSK
ncbi:lectin C-type domain protein [Teladorsagia circumcincta]|uniref:Lectin C-type domain protein n=1 Tax=Teladorsagia circumcincta TaxID=45464 RepID=A0A2G9TCF9_TELCI|nr:lectin C-type domain protein [Teladorsagia circumcincta]